MSLDRRLSGLAVGHDLPWLPDSEVAGHGWPRGVPYATAQEHRRSHHTPSNLVSFSRARKLEERGQRWLIQPHLDILARSPGKFAARMMECCIRTCCGPGIDPEMITLFLSLSRRVCVLLTPSEGYTVKLPGWNTLAEWLPIWSS